MRWQGRRGKTRTGTDRDEQRCYDYDIPRRGSYGIQHGCGVEVVFILVLYFNGHALG